MRNRVAKAVSLGCDGIEPDNMDVSTSEELRIATDSRSLEELVVLRSLPRARVCFFFRGAPSPSDPPKKCGWQGADGRLQPQRKSVKWLKGGVKVARI